MALTALKDRFSGKAAAAGIAAALMVSPFGGATAQDAQPQQQAEFTQAATVTNVATHRDATRAAGEWSQRNDGVSVAVYLGTESRVTPDQIEQILTREINGAGVSNVAFFYEQNDTPATGVAYAYAGDVDGPFHLGEARPAAAKAAEQYLYQRQFAYNLER